MSRFYFFIWLQWAVKLTLYTALLTFFIAAFITLVIYISQGTGTLDNEITRALLTIFKFWFMVSWNFALLIVLFRSLKYIFNKCIKGYVFVLLGCPKEETNEETGEIIDEIGYGDLLKVWRKWFMLMIWTVAGEMIVAVIVMKLFSSYESVFTWFNMYVLHIFILIAGFFSFIVLSVKCKKVQVKKC
ncbi:hypothetical protein [Sulfurimonas hydrogeniphila]|uniref:hypothetical protein n=1 Tax=Sulfurimonas TaxID=202746 RepID=UPI00125F6C85|nr:hypothetical protein [Sulfurimonas hydrogeniphila]